MSESKEKPTRNLNFLGGTDELERIIEAALFATDETLSIRLGSSMRLTKKTNFSAYAEHVDRTSDNEDLVYTLDIIGAALTWTHKF